MRIAQGVLRQDWYLLLFISDGQLFRHHVHSKFLTEPYNCKHTTLRNIRKADLLEDAIAQCSPLSKSRLWVSHPPSNVMFVLFTWRRNLLFSGLFRGLTFRQDL